MRGSELKEINVKLGYENDDFLVEFGDNNEKTQMVVRRKIIMPLLYPPKKY